MGSYRFIDHTADLGIEVTGKTLEDLFAAAAKALVEQVTDPDKVRPEKEYIIEVEGRDESDLLVKWLKEILSLFHIEYFLSGRFEVLELGSAKMKGLVRGETYDAGRHALKTEIKAVTYHQAEIRRTQEGYLVVVIMDT
jgi:SHS2 domain-containing protein